MSRSHFKTTNSPKIPIFTISQKRHDLKEQDPSAALFLETDRTVTYDPTKTTVKIQFLNYQDETQKITMHPTIYLPHVTVCHFIIAFNQETREHIFQHVSIHELDKMYEVLQAKLDKGTWDLLVIDPMDQFKNGYFLKKINHEKLSSITVLGQKELGNPLDSLIGQESKKANGVGISYNSATGKVHVVSHNDYSISDTQMIIDTPFVPISSLNSLSLFASTPESKKNKFQPPDELINAIKNEIKNFRETKNLLTIGFNRKADRIENALQFAMTHLNEINSVDGFLDYKKENQMSIREAMQSPRKNPMNKTAWGDTDSWKKIDAIVNSRKQKR